MKRKRRIIALVLSGLFLAYFAASSIFVPKAPGLKDQDTSIVKLENNEECLKHGLLRSSSSEHTEDAVKFFDDFATISNVESFHTLSQQNRFDYLEGSQFGRFDIYLSIRRLQI